MYKGRFKIMANQVQEDFNWDIADNRGFGGGYTKQQKADMEKMYENTLHQVTEKEVVTGTVVGMTDRDVILNIGFKSDGLIPLSECRDMENLKVGDEVDVFVEDQEDLNG